MTTKPNGLIYYSGNAAVYDAASFFESTLQGATAVLVLTRRFTPDFDTSNGLVYVVESQTVGVGLRVVTSKSDAEVAAMTGGDIILFKADGSPRWIIPMLDGEAQDEADQAEGDIGQLEPYTNVKTLASVTNQRETLDTNSSFAQSLLGSNPYTLGASVNGSDGGKVAQDLEKLNKLMHFFNRYARQLAESENMIHRTDPGVQDPVRDNAIQAIETSDDDRVRDVAKAIIDQPKIDEIRNDIERFKEKINTLISRYGTIEFTFPLNKVAQNSELRSRIGAVLASNMKAEGVDPMQSNLMAYLTKKVAEVTAETFVRL